MSTDNPIEKSDENEGQKLEEKSKISVFLNFIRRNPMLTTAFVSIAALLLLYFFMTVKMGKMERRHTKALQHVTDSLNLNHMMNNVRIFSWGVRSELSRGNTEQVEQFFINYLQTGNVVKLQLIDPHEGKVILATDRKDIDVAISNSVILNATSVTVIDGGATYQIANPIMGLDKKIGIVIVEIEK